MKKHELFFTENEADNIEIQWTIHASNSSKINMVSSGFKNFHILTNYTASVSVV